LWQKQNPNNFLEKSLGPNGRMAPYSDSSRFFLFSTSDFSSWGWNPTLIQPAVIQPPPIFRSTIALSRLACL